MKELLITGAWRCGEQQVQALEQMDAAKKILLENADNISGVNAYDQFLKDAGDSHDSEE